ncbi:hypothetical protein [Chryseobacterium indoltheticum]|uniref:hypothetical protein n=1 Tax=Chryseobacterium indoltheticum TaxID=254 RepID=UPI001911EBCF|nr:hypothetical protein [Chryseobacterium indoltheticum]QQQ26779.1 hypothetical protein JJL46_11665 [Chryseobacterium indoltheticum]
MKKIASSLLISISLLINAQTGNENVYCGNFFMRGSKISTKEYVVDGTPYINGDKFHEVIIMGYSKYVQDLRYNAYEDEMEFKKDDELFYANKEDNITFQFPKLSKEYNVLIILTEIIKYSDTWS